MPYRFIEETITPGGGERGTVKAAKALMDAMINGHVTGLALVNAGSGYVVGDILTLAPVGATAIFNCRIQVLSVSGGAIATFAMRSSGAFSVLPDITNASEPTTGGTGSGATFQVTSVEGPYEAEVAAGGSGYSVGDIVTVSGGTLHAGASALQFVVTDETGGAVTALAPYRIGRYDALPSNPAATTGGAGDLTLSLVHANWRMPLSATSDNYTDDSTNFEFWMEGKNSAGGNPVVGVQLITNGANRQWGFACATGFNPLQTFAGQPNANPRVVNYLSPGTQGGCRIPTTDSAVQLFLQWSPRHINVVSRTAPTYEHAYLGLYVPFVDSPATKYPYPLICCGTTTNGNIDINSAFNGRVANSSTQHSSIVHHGSPFTGTDNAPWVLRDLVGNWIHFDNSQQACRIWPMLGNPTAPEAPNLATGSGTLSWITGSSPQDGSASQGFFNENTALNPTPFGPGGQNLYFMVAPIIWQQLVGTSCQLLGELSGCYALNGRGLSAEDRITDAQGRRYFVFTDTINNENRNFIALLEG